MSTTQPAGSAQPIGSGMKAVTISRQYGSGGGEIGVRLARHLSWHLIDHEIVARVANDLGISEQTAEVRDEFAESFIGRVVRQFVPPLLTTFDPSSQTAEDRAEEGRYHEALRRVVVTAADSGQVVIVGRGSQSILADRRDVLHVRIIAPLPQRIAYVALRENLSTADARERIQLKDRDRVRNLQAMYHVDASDPMLYDLVINTGVLSLDRAVDLISIALEDKARALTVPANELGPARGLTRYPGQPGDIRPPA